MKQSAIAIFFSISFGPASIVGSAVGGMLVQDFGFRTMYAVAAGIAFLALVLTLAFLKEPPPPRGKTGA